MVASKSGLLRTTSMAALILLAFGLVSCDGDSGSDQVVAPGSGSPAPTFAITSDIAVLAQRPGPTAFISFLDLTGTNVSALVEISYTIAAKAGTASRPVSVTYTIESLRDRGRVSGSTVTLPVFGLYANLSNSVTVNLRFTDNSVKVAPAMIVTPDYAIASPFKTPSVTAMRGTSAALGFDFFLMKPNSVQAPATIIDSDGNIRWASTSLVDQAVLFRANGIDIADSSKSALNREELDGSTKTVTPSNPSFVQFHHELTQGKVGILAQPNLTGRLEDYLAELTPDGVEIRSWDFASIFEKYMRSQGDDPALFVRRGVDWFHVNSAIYDARDNSIIASSRENFIVKLDYDTGSIKWIFGDTTKYWHSFASLRAKALTLTGEGLAPIGQHSLSIAPDGELLMFNNGYASMNQPAGAAIGASRLYSAVTGFFIDPVAKTATPGITFDDNKTVHSIICSSAYISPDGSMLIQYSQAENGTILRMKGLNPERQTVFDFSYSTVFGCINSWSATIVPFANIRFSS